MFYPLAFNERQVLSNRDISMSSFFEQTEKENMSRNQNRSPKSSAQGSSKLETN